MNKLQTEEQLAEIIASNKQYIIFKHSVTCPISKGAFREFQSYMEQQKSIPAFYLYIQEARPLSNQIAERFGIRHESPQVLYIQNGNVVWNDSHGNITKQSLQEHIG